MNPGKIALRFFIAVIILAGIPHSIAHFKGNYQNPDKEYKEIDDYLRLFYGENEEDVWYNKECLNTEEFDYYKNEILDYYKDSNYTESDLRLYLVCQNSSDSIAMNTIETDSIQKLYEAYQKDSVAIVKRWENKQVSFEEFQAYYKDSNYTKSDLKQYYDAWMNDSKVEKEAISEEDFYKDLLGNWEVSYGEIYGIEGIQRMNISWDGNEFVGTFYEFESEDDTKEKMDEKTLDIELTETDISGVYHLSFEGEKYKIPCFIKLSKNKLRISYSYESKLITENWKKI